MTERHSPTKMVLSAASCAGAALAGSFFTRQSLGGWYAALLKPDFNPPAWVFGPVWTVLYALMAVSLYLVWRRRPTPKRRLALKLFAVQLALNVLWSAVFFGLRSPGGATVVILALLAAIIQTARLFRTASPLAASLLLPYLAWVFFAALLNIAIWHLNL